MAAETSRGEESARLSYPLLTEAVPSWDYALIFSEPNTGWKSGEASLWTLRAACMTGWLIAQNTGETSPPFLQIFL
jgi:hypothetical protein